MVSIRRSCADLRSPRVTWTIQGNGGACLDWPPPLALTRDLRPHHHRPRCHGWPALHPGLRFPIATVMAMLADGISTAEILAEHPDLTPEDIHESLLYAAEAVRERELPPRRTA
jgi:uncharacterized protein (DUF433 family)